MTGWVALCAMDDVPRRGARVARAGDVEIAIFRTQEDGVYALENRCPHKNGPLSEGIVHDNAVTCPLHNWVIALDTGEARGPDEGCVRSFEAETRDGQVWIKL